MALGTLALTLAEWAKRVDPDGNIDAVVEILNETNEILEDMLFMEGNLPTGHRTTVRTDLPSVAWRKLNYGVKPSKSKTKQVTDSCGMLEGYAEVDKSLADLNGNTAEFRLSEDRSFLEAMNQNMANTVMYGDTDEFPERFLGLGPRYGSLSDGNVIDAGGSGSDTTSIWLICWGDNTVHGTFPKGSKAGLNQDDKGQVTLTDGEGGNYEGYRTHYKWDVGMVVRDWRYVVRIANIDTGTWPTADDLIKYMIMAMNKIPFLRMGRPAWYMNRDAKTILDVANTKMSNSWIQHSEDAGGKPVTKFRGMHVRQVDAILSTETALEAA